MRSICFSFLKFTGVCSLLFGIFFMAGTQAISAESTLLHLDFQDGQGSPVRVDRATLVMVVGNYVDRLPLEVTEGGVDLPLDASWLKAHWPGGKDRLKNMDRAYLFLKAPGYASICSNPINWMGTESGGLGKSVVISFPHSKIMVVMRGRKSSVTLNFREPAEKFLRLSNGKGKPLAGVKVKSYIYWSKSENGELNGADLLGEGTSDATGRVPLVDGDFTYAFQVARKDKNGDPAGNVLIVKRFEGNEHPLAVPDDAGTDAQK